ncbi:hypothetical protein [Selenomonas montiformis]|nr:hypothetical protein [Selenomonas montiformis]
MNDGKKDMGKDCRFSPAVWAVILAGNDGVSSSGKETSACASDF